MTTTDATALMARMTATLRASEERDYDHISLNVDESDLRALLSLVAQGEADRERWQWCANNGVDLVCQFAAGDKAFTASVDTTFMDGGFWAYAQGATPADAVDALRVKVAARATPTEGPTHG